MDGMDGMDEMDEMDEMDGAETAACGSSRLHSCIPVLHIGPFHE